MSRARRHFPRFFSATTALTSWNSLALYLAFLYFSIIRYKALWLLLASFMKTSSLAPSISVSIWVIANDIASYSSCVIVIVIFSSFYSVPQYRAAPSSQMVYSPVGPMNLPLENALKPSTHIFRVASYITLTAAAPRGLLPAA